MCRCWCSPDLAAQYAGFSPDLTQHLALLVSSPIVAEKPRCWSFLWRYWELAQYKNKTLRQLSVIFLLRKHDVTFLSPAVFEVLFIGWLITGGCWSKTPKSLKCPTNESFLDLPCVFSRTSLHCVLALPALELCFQAVWFLPRAESVPPCLPGGTSAPSAGTKVSSKVNKLLVTTAFC